MFRIVFDQGECLHVGMNQPTVVNRGSSVRAANGVRLGGKTFPHEPMHTAGQDDQSHGDGVMSLCSARV